MRRLLLLALLPSFSGCTLYFDDDKCDGWGVPEPSPPALELRDPQTGECVPHGGGGWCESSCGEPCPAIDLAVPDWGACFSECESLAPGTCAATPGCREAYILDAETDGPPKFFGCWAISPSGPVGGSCEGLDAHACSMHDNCAALYAPNIEGGQSFLSCLAEQGVDACAAVDCGPGTHCEQQCFPCDSADGTTCPPQCQPMCVPDENLCAATTCPVGHDCVEVCDPPPPGCEPGTPGTCHVDCVPVQACEASANETECVSKAGCTPVYIGDDCTCTPAGCTCEVQTYDHCETK